VYDDLPIAKIVDVLIDAAYQDKASDIHIEPEEKQSLIRVRIDGVLHEVLRVPKVLHDRIITRIKVLSGLRTDEHMSAQDGKMRMALEEENLDIRVSIIPIAEGEKAVLRLLSSRSREYTLVDLGMNEADLKKVNAAYNKSYGMILSTGPTGSGKTTSIYAILKILNTREKNITTIEDPVEYRIRGANQVQVNAKTNLTFANGLRSILRQDPNIIFVGEIRDSETAGIAVNAALTGHLVLSTLHTNDAATAIPRLSDMKVEPFLVASTVNIIIAQRLVRKICDMCKTTVTMTQEELKKHLPEETIKRHFGDEATLKLYKGKGCKICHNTGYNGRLGVFEVLEVSKDVRKLISEHSDSDEINKKALEEGMTTMLDDGLDKVKRGLTSIEEVVRVTKVESI
jgi:type II secretory ATPase GspE/PulE/Tfp pilus assembly ATPase PilB-like protein